MRNSTSATKNTILAISTAAPAMPPKPSTAAMRAMIRSVTTRLSMTYLSEGFSIGRGASARRQPAFGIAQLSAEHAGKRRRRAAEQQRHEGPEREIGAGLGGLVGGLLRGRACLAFHRGDAALRLVGRQPGAGGDHLREIGPVAVVELALGDAADENPCRLGAGLGAERGLRARGGNADGGGRRPPLRSVRPAGP